MDIEKIGGDIVHAAIKIRRASGPEESVCQKRLAYELERMGRKVECALKLPVEQGPVEIDAGCRLDMLGDGCAIVENETVESIRAVDRLERGFD